jgi:type I restriction-modification system DNA methylase subunit
MASVEKGLKDRLTRLAKLNISKFVKRGKGRVEENVKIKLTLPLLELLGYDAQKDMDFEHHVKDKRVDIALMFDDKPKLLVETKDLNENLDNHVNKSLDYAFNKGVEWVLLTNGVGIRLYKSFIEGVPPEDRKLFSTTLKELPKSFPSLAERISKENLKAAERITKDAEAVKENVTAKILIKDLTECKNRLFRDLYDQFHVRYKKDENFKVTIDSWADRVNMKLDDPNLIDKLCLEGAYTLINRALFLRICEDKGHVKTKLDKTGLEKWREMVEKPSRILGLAFAEIADRFEGLYKAPLFDDIRYEDIKWDEADINFILDTLSQHDFGEITKDILGQAYEQHISKEERKELGQFYTPDFIIHYILDRVELSPDKKVLDLACGSGGFLVRTYDRLKEQYRKEGWQESAVHKEILTKNLHGIDINPFATQLSVMNLFLKDLEHPTSQLNIAEGDSLVRLENCFDMEYFQRATPVNRVTKSDKRYSHGKILKEMPFDVVVGNPPYISFGVRGSRDAAKSKRNQLELLRQNYPNSAEYKISIYAIFIQRAIEMLKAGGYLGYIVPDSFLLGRYFSRLRRYILNTCEIKEVVLFTKDFWKLGIVGRPIILILKKQPDDKKRKSNKVTTKLCGSVSELEKGQSKSYSYSQRFFEKTVHNRFRLFFDSESKSFASKIEKASTNLGELVSIHVGVRSKIGQKRVISESKKGVNWKRGLISGGQVLRYWLKYEGHFINIEPKLLWSGGWDSELISQRKILLRKTGDRLVAAYDDKGLYHLDNLHSMVLKHREYELKYVLAILNSELMNRYYQLISLESGRAMAQTDIETLELLPIKVGSRTQVRKVTTLVDKMLSLNESLLKAQSPLEEQKLKAEIEETDRDIETQIRDIYGFG